MPSDRPQSLIQTPSDHWKQAEYMSYPAVENHLKVRCRPIKGDYQYPPFKSNQLGSCSSLLLPMLYLDHFKKRRAEPGKLSTSGSLLRYQPYWTCKFYIWLKHGSSFQYNLELGNNIFNISLCSNLKAWANKICFSNYRYLWLWRNLCQLFSNCVNKTINMKVKGNICFLYFVIYVIAIIVISKILIYRSPTAIDADNCIHFGKWVSWLSAEAE